MAVRSLIHCRQITENGKNAVHYLHAVMNGISSSICGGLAQGVAASKLFSQRFDEGGRQIFDDKLRHITVGADVLDVIFIGGTRQR